MAFHVETSTIPGAIGAGPPAPKFIDYTHRLRFENAQTGDQAEALATFGDGPELAEAALWAHRAHGFDLTEVETFNAREEHKRRKAAAEDLAERMEDAQGEAQRILAAAHEEATRIIQAANTQADDMIAACARDIEKAKAEAAAGDQAPDSGTDKGKGK
jgi:hypothetical protein